MSSRSIATTWSKYSDSTRAVIRPAMLAPTTMARRPSVFVTDLRRSRCRISDCILLHNQGKNSNALCAVNQAPAASDIAAHLIVSFQRTAEVADARSKRRKMTQMR